MLVPVEGEVEVLACALSGFSTARSLKVRAFLLARVLVDVLGIEHLGAMKRAKGGWRYARGERAEQSTTVASQNTGRVALNPIPQVFGGGCFDACNLTARGLFLSPNWHLWMVIKHCAGFEFNRRALHEKTGVRHSSGLIHSPSERSRARSLLPPFRLLRSTSTPVNSFCITLSYSNLVFNRSLGPTACFRNYFHCPLAFPSSYIHSCLCDCGLPKYGVPSFSILVLPSSPHCKSRFIPAVHSPNSKFNKADIFFITPHIDTHGSGTKPLKAAQFNFVQTTGTGM